MDGVLHNSRLPRYRLPFGAVETGGALLLHIDLPAAAHARLRLWVQDHEEILEGERTDGGCTFRLQAPQTSGNLWYFFLLDTPEGPYSYGGTGGAGALYRHGEPPGYQITVYEPYATPEWFKTGVCYQIFPDRFARGGARGGLDRADYHRALRRRVLLHEDWNEPVNYRPCAGERFFDPCDFYGGDLDGIREKLPYLKTLGVTCLYLNPVFESPSNHRYNTADYTRIDPILGDTEALERLAAAAREQGMRLMFDGVFSHTGDDSVYFNKYGRYPGQGAYQSKDSPYYPWYDFSAFPDDYRCWWGFKTLPELRESDSGYMEFVARLLRRWAAAGVTSWRLDVADELPDGFIAFLRETLKALDPQGVLLGEVWEDASNKTAYGKTRGYVHGRELDSAMGYPFRAALLDFLLYRADAGGLNDRLLTLMEHYPRPFYEAQLNILGSHDTVRILTALSDAPDRDALTREAQADYAPSPEALSRGRKRLLLAAMALLSLPGVPCIYYGDEAGMTGMADPFCRGTYPWGREDTELRDCYTRLCAARTRSAALRTGACGMRALGPDVFAAMRATAQESALLILNRGELSQTLRLGAADFAEGPALPAIRPDARYRDVLSGAVAAAQDGRIQVVLQPLSGAVLIEERD